MTLTAPTQSSRILVTSHNTGIGHTPENSIERAGSSVLGSYHKRGIPIPAVVDNGETLIPLTNRSIVVAFAKVDAADAADLEQYRWQLFDRSAKGWPSYAYRVTGLHGTVTVPMHRQVLGLETGNPWHVDHINGDGLDNRRENLRRVTRAQNMQNYRRVQSRNKTGFRGVRAMRSGRFTAQVVLKGKLALNGTYDTAIEAAYAACTWRAEHMPFTTACGLEGCREGTYIHA